MNNNLTNILGILEDKYEITDTIFNNETKGITIFIRCGIEIQNYNKALETIKVQLDDLKNGKIEEEDIENAKKLIISSVKSITSEQDTEITYYYGQELAGTLIEISDYENKVNAVTKEQIQEIANSVSINTIYFLKD